MTTAALALHSDTAAPMPEAMLALVDALRTARGNITNATRARGLSRETFYAWSRQNAAFRSACEEIREERLDRAESALDDLVEERNPAAVFFTLRTLGRSRGYIERQELTHEVAELKPVDVDLELRKARQLIADMSEE